MASAGPREDEKIDDWVNQMDTILGGLDQVVQMLQAGCSNVSMSFRLMTFICRKFWRLFEVFGVHSVLIGNCCCFSAYLLGCYCKLCLME